uniref:Chromosome segregation SMC protein n=1 Tax=Pseudomonas viridiflava TaxID=33069 RepID=I6LCH2_PSEVI|nr:hypothetical protein [Pseudomonas viridiflava]
MNSIEQLKDNRATLVTEMEAIRAELPSLEAALESDEVINNGRESHFRDEISSRKLKIDAINQRVFVLDQKLHRVEKLANRETLMAQYIADMAGWADDEVELKTKRQSLSKRLEEVRQQAQEEINSARQAETLAATAYAQAVAWGDAEGEKTANSDAQKAAKNLTAATEQYRRHQLIVTALEQELKTVDQHITEAQEKHKKLEQQALNLAMYTYEEKWNEAAQALLDVGGKLYAVQNLIGRDAVALLKLDIPEQGENYGSWKWRDLADRSSGHRTQDLLSI